MTSAVLQLPRQPRLRPTTVPPGPGPSARPVLRVVVGGRDPERLARRAVYRRRRLVAAALAVVVLATTILLASAAWARVAGGGTPASVAGATSSTYLVQPGDTLWSIARELAPGADVRLVVDRLVDLNGKAPLQVGQRLVLA